MLLLTRESQWTNTETVMTQGLFTQACFIPSEQSRKQTKGPQLSEPHERSASAQRGTPARKSTCMRMPTCR